MIRNRHCNVYVASCAGNGGIYQYSLDDNGKLELINITELDRPMYMTASENKIHIVLRQPFSDNNNSGVISFDVDKNGRLGNPTDIISTNGEVGCHILSDNGNIYCTNYISGTVIKMPDTLVAHQGCGIDKIRQTSPHTHFVGLTPDNKYICVVDLGIDTIFIYNKDMTLYSKAKVPEGHGARHAVFSQNGEYMFCVNELKSTVSVFKYTNGKLALLDTVGVLSEDFNGESTAAAIRIRENIVYASNRGHDSISQLEYTNGKLKLIRTIQCGGSSPRDFNFINKFMICANEESNNITVFDCINDFKQIGDYKIQAPLCII